MNELEKKSIKYNINSIKSENIERTLLITKYCFTVYLKSIFKFGLKSGIPKEVATLWKNFIILLKEETRILNIISKYPEFTNFYTGNLDSLNEKTISYYEDILELLDNINKKATTSKTKTKTKSTVSMTLGFDDVKIFLDYPPEFWKYIKDKTITIDGYAEKERDFYGVVLRESNKVANVKLIVPKITDLRTALVNVCEYQNAYKLYQKINNISDENFDRDTKIHELEQEFKKNYLIKKYHQLIKK